MFNKKFDLPHTLHELKHFLPSQMTLKDFIHHNTLHAFQDMKFYDGIFRASKMFGYKVTLQLQEYRKLFSLGRIKESVIERIIIDRKGEKELENWSKKLLYANYDENIYPLVGNFRSQWKKIFKIDIDSQTNPILYRILSAYLDQGISEWKFPNNDEGFLDAIKTIEKNSKTSIFKTKKAKDLLLNKKASIIELLNILVGDESDFETYLFDLSFSSRGWFGIVSTIEQNPNILIHKKDITLNDLIHVSLLFEIDTLTDNLGENWKPLSIISETTSEKITKSIEISELDEIYKIWQDAFEWSYYDTILNGIQQNIQKSNSTHTEPSFQSIFCIDDRECSLRRHIEHLDPLSETFGAPGFFGVEFYFKQKGGKFIEKLCPVPVYPKHLIKEEEIESRSTNNLYFSKYSFGLLTGLCNTILLGIPTFKNLFKIVFNPKKSSYMSDSFSHMDKQSKLTIENKSITNIEDGLQIGFTIDEMTIRVETFLRNIGLINNFSKNIYIIAHGSSSANNPLYRAYECGACSGRPGSVNARVFAYMANHKNVRERLKLNGIEIPITTTFIAGLHDTTNDKIDFYDENELNQLNKENHTEFTKLIENALLLNAKERSRRFASINTNGKLYKIKKEIEKRAFSMSEPRPELGHGTNALAIIGRRKITKGLFLDRRAFLNSYNYQTDLDGFYLAKVMAPIGIVCGGINLEYYFSRVDNVKLGCGTKLPHNVNGLIGLTNSFDGDLRPGLSWQMIEPHDPVRLLVIVEHFPEVVLKSIKSTDEIYEWYKNEWVHLVAIHPENKEIYYFKDEAMNHYHTTLFELKSINNVHKLFEDAPSMINNSIHHATFENLPIYQIENTL